MRLQPESLFRFFRTYPTLILVGFDCETVDLPPRDCLSSIRNWTQHLNGSVQSVNASSYQLFVDKKTECNSRQETYETKFCEHRKDSVSGCQEALRCYEREKPVYDEQAELVGSWLGRQIFGVLDVGTSFLRWDVVFSCRLRHDSPA